MTGQGEAMTAYEGPPHGGGSYLASLCNQEVMLF
jgi:hypothetical protein